MLQQKYFKKLYLHDCFYWEYQLGQDWFQLTAVFAGEIIAKKKGICTIMIIKYGFSHDNFPEKVFLVISIKRIW